MTAPYVWQKKIQWENKNQGQNIFFYELERILRKIFVKEL
jgi:hypothetical protein